MTEKLCPACNTVKPSEEFYRLRAGPKKGALSGYCKPCARAQARKAAKNPETRARMKARREAWMLTPQGRLKQLLTNARRRARDFNLPFTLTEAFLRPKLERGLCEVTGLPFDFAFNSPWAPSLDQTIPKGGYTPGNTKLVVWAYNIAKQSFTHEDVVRLARALTKQ